MNDDLKLFENFLANPGGYKTREFYNYIRAWARYINAHKDDFNYLEDEEWQEIRERVNAAYLIKEDIKAEYEELEERSETVCELEFTARAEYFRDWMAFMETYQDEFEFTDEQIAEGREKLEETVRLHEEWLLAEERAKISKLEYEKSLEDLDDALAEHYERTGKIPVISALKHHKGN